MGEKGVSEQAAIADEGILTEPARSSEPESKDLTKKVHASAALIGGVIGAASALLTTFFLVRPNLAPSTANQARITNVVAEPAVTLEQYFGHPSVRSALRELKRAYPQRTLRLLEGERSRLHKLGTVVHFEVELQGVRGIPIASRWSLFDGDTGRRLAESEDLDPLPLRFSIEKNDLDTGTMETWVDTSGIQAATFFVRLELYDERSDTRVTFRDSEKFPAPRS